MEVQKLTEQLAEKLILDDKENEKQDASHPRVASELLIQPSSGNLQTAFEKFRKRKIDALKTAQPPKIVFERKSQEFRDYLRKKFVEQAKKYVGTPYAKRFLEPSHPQYNSKLFLDCCALVRQAVEDLRDEFGFMIPRLNQSYQFDTLPKSIRFDELIPGDLIFYQGTYFNPKLCKRQAHDLVHVEIFLGGASGEETIGSRWNNGCVSIFPSYKFVSKLYYDVKHHYKSIETWLDGTLQNFCQEHHWVDKPLLLHPQQKSIFKEGEAIQAADDEELPGEAEPTDN